MKQHSDNLPLTRALETLFSGAKPTQASSGIRKHQLEFDRELRVILHSLRNNSVDGRVDSMRTLRAQI
jgi:hypothetical protein